MDYKKLQAEHFERTWHKNKKLFQGEGVYVDPYLDNIEHDSRRYLTSIARLPKNLEPKVEYVIKRLQMTDPSQYYYPLESIHSTIQNIRVVADPPTWSSKDILKVKKAFSDIIKTYRSFIIEIRGLNVSPSTVFIQGFPDKTLAVLRKKLNQALIKIGVPDNQKYDKEHLYRIYKIGGAYLNIVRFKNHNIQNLINEIEKLRNYNFGIMKVNKIELVETDKYFLKSKTKVIATFRLK